MSPVRRRGRRREGDSVHGAGAELGLYEAHAVGPLVVGVPVAVGGNHRARREHRQSRNDFEQRRVLGVVGNVMMKKCRHARRDVHRLVECRRVLPGLNPSQRQECDDGDEHHPQPNVPHRVVGTMMCEGDLCGLVGQ